MYKTICVVAELGGGKTLLTTAFILKLAAIWRKMNGEKADVFCNYPIVENKLTKQIMNFEYLNGNDEDTYERFTELNNCIIGLDEIDLWFPAQEENKAFKRNYIETFKKLRKRNNVLFYNTQSLSFMNINVRRFTTDVLQCNTIHNNNWSYTDVRDYRFYAELSPSKRFVFQTERTIYNIHKFFKYYDTDFEVERLRIPSNLLTRKNRKEREENE